MSRTEIVFGLDPDTADIFIALGRDVAIDNGNPIAIEFSPATRVRLAWLQAEELQLEAAAAVAFPCDGCVIAFVVGAACQLVK